MQSITITIEAKNREFHHKITLFPSVAVNPPAIGYYSGVKKSWAGQFIETDNRLESFTDFIVTMLSSDKYPNPPICSRRKASQIAKQNLPKLIKNLKHTKRTSVSILIL